MKPGTYSARIPYRIVRYPKGARVRWTTLFAAWEASGRRDWSVWEEFEPIADSPRFTFATFRTPAANFAEAMIAKELHEQGYTCWQGGVCGLFHSKNLGGQAAEQTAIIERMLMEQGLPRPIEYQHRFSVRPCNLDVTAHHPERGWRFAEVKRGDSLRPGQLATLAFLHHLLDAQVEVVRVIPERRRVIPRAFLDCEYTLT